MENKQAQMFKSGKPSRMPVHSLPDSNDIEEENTITPPPQFHITTTDHHVLEIVSTYIKKVPDKNSKKQLARIMINFIMKSANL